MTASKGKHGTQFRFRGILFGLTFVLTIAAVMILMQTGAKGAFYFTAAPLSPNTDTQVKLDWSPVNGAAAYKLERDDGVTVTTPASIIVSQSSNFTSFTDGAAANFPLTPETTYTYTLRAYSDEGFQHEIPVASNTASAATSTMLRPTVVTAKYNINTSAVELNWINNSKATLASDVRAVDSSGNVGAVIQSLNTSGTAMTFTDPALTSGSANYAVVSRGLSGSTTLSSIPSYSFTVSPINSPSISAAMNQGVATISWGAFAYIAQFNLERAKYNSADGSWGDWQIVNSQLAAGLTSTTNTPASGGMYRYRLNAKTESDYSGYILSQPVSKPVAPSSLEAALLSKNQIDLKWVKNAENPSKLRIERRIDSTTFELLATIDEFESTYSYISNLNANTTYTFRITAYDTATNYSSSSECTISTATPSAPTGLSLVKESSTQIRLYWNDNSNSESGFCVERKEGAGDFVQVNPNVPYNTRTCTDSAIVGHDYTYRIYARSPFGNSSYSNEVTASGTISILAPSSLSVVAASSSQLDLTWAYGGTGSYTTTIERKTGTDGAWTTIFTSAGGVLKYSDTGLSANTQYFYRVKNAVGSGVYSVSYPNNESGIGAYTMLGGLPLSGTAGSNNTIVLSWSGNTGNADIIIERKMASGNFAALATVSASTVSWTDTTGLIQGASYTYRIKAKSTSNESVYSSEATVLNVYLNAPTGLMATAGADKKIELSWTDNSSDETGFEVWRYIYGNGSYQLYATVDANVNKYADTNIQAGVQYNYIVRAFKLPATVYSTYTATASAGLGMLSPPTDLKFSVISTTQVLLMWTDNANNESGFKIERRLPGETAWTTVSYVGANAMSYLISELTPYVKYIYRVRVYNYTGNFDSFSEEIEVSTGLPAIPANVTGQALTSSQVKITWVDAAFNETGYNIERRLERSTSIQTFHVGAGVTQFVDGGLYSNSTYMYKVIAVNNNGSVPAAEIRVTTKEAPVFKDVNANYSWAREAIENLAGRGILQGKTSTTFKPNDKISKAEFTVIMMRAFKLNDSTPVGTLADVKVGRWYYKEVMIAENLGIISRDSGGRFYPDQAITREEMAVIIAKTLAVVDKPLGGYGNSVLEKFWDKSLISSSALSSMASVVGEGIMSGRTETSIAPKYNATRAEAAVMLYKVIDR